VEDGGRATQDVTRGPHITKAGPKGPLHADLKGKIEKDFSAKQK